MDELVEWEYLEPGVKFRCLGTIWLVQRRDELRKRVWCLSIEDGRYGSMPLAIDKHVYVRWRNNRIQRQSPQWQERQRLAVIPG